MNTLKNNHCCKALTSLINDDYCPIFYNEKFRRYAVKDIESTSCITLTYCPFCAQKLPKSLRNLWCDTLREQHKIEDPLNDYKEQAPKEFHSDEWWKKRDL